MKFKYYKRGQGELDTSNFPEIVEKGYVHVERLDSKTFVSLLALNTYLLQTLYIKENIEVIVSGYVDHMRSDKDIYTVSDIYYELNRLNIDCVKCQHESNDKIKSGTISKENILYELGLGVITKDYTFIGADSSVSKFFEEVNCQAEKVRVDGKVISNVVRETLDYSKPIIIVDDILGGGATVRMLVEFLRRDTYTGTIDLWVQYNEGIHSDEFLELFDEYYLGDNI